MELSEMEDFEQTAWEDYEEELEELAQHPLNLNTATREEMEHLPFLTPSQVEDIQAYLHRYHGMKTMAELALIPSISWYQRQLMNSFFYVADETPRQSSCQNSSDRASPVHRHRCDWRNPGCENSRNCPAASATANDIRCFHSADNRLGRTRRHG